MSACLTLHSTGKSGYIGRLLIPEDFQKSLVGDNKYSQVQRKPKPQVIFILDRSGSMGQWVGRMANVVFPWIAEHKFGMSPEDHLTLITFDSRSEKIVTTVKGLEKLDIGARGCTYMGQVFNYLLGSVDEANPNIEIVAISDGGIWDSQQTLAQANLAAAQLRKGSYSISVTAIRLMTSSSQPDTRALASILQLDTSTAGSLIDLPATEADHLKYILDTLGSNEEFATGHMVLQTDTTCIRQHPWNPAASKILFTLPTKSSTVSFWVDEPPKKATVNGSSVNIQLGEPVTQETLGLLLGDQLRYFMSKLRILMVLNSYEAKEELDSIIAYFNQLENSLPSEDIEPLQNDRKLHGRLQFMRKRVARELRSVSLAMQTLANDEKVKKLDLAQQADYLREASSSMSKTTRNFAKRAVECGLDFDSVMQAEALAMLAHADELKDINDSDHAVSFYSQATTLEGIQCMLELAREPEVLNQLTAPEMLRLFNVVDIPATGPVGDFPDPMSYRVTKFLPGTYISIADLTTAWNQGGLLTAPGGSKKETISTAIPFFEDGRVQSFLQKYARSSLEYMSSIGMRRMIAEVPKTYPYTICAGLWKMVEELDDDKSELAIKHFCQLAQTYEQCTVGMFDHIIPLLEEKQDPELSYNLGHNGITNMLGPILHLIRTHQTENLDRILRALYSFETYQVMRRMFKDDGLEGRINMLDKILGVDFSSNQVTPLPALFTRSELEHCSQAKINLEDVQNYKKALQYIHYVTLVSQLFEAFVNSSGDDDCIKCIKSIPKMSESSISTALGLPLHVSLDDFMLFNVVEGLLHSTKQERVSKVTDKPLLKDLGNAHAGLDMIAEYIRSRYAQDYDRRLRQQLGEERSILRAELTHNLIKSTDMESFVSLIAAGNTRGPVSVTMDRDNCVGFERLHKELLDDSKAVPLRVLKLRVIYTGKSPTGENAFNGGNLLRTNWKSLEELLVRLGESSEWECLQEQLKLRGHVYRGGSLMANRHGHSNDLPSYFAYGCMSLEDYHNAVASETWESYIQEHYDCCGVPEFLAKIQILG